MIDKLFTSRNQMWATKRFQIITRWFGVEGDLTEEEVIITMKWVEDAVDFLNKMRDAKMDMFIAEYCNVSCSRSGWGK